MKATELRIGNYVSYKDISTIEVEHSEITEIYFGATNYKPISITKEWLLKLGFKKEERKLYSLYVDDNLDVSIWSDIYFRNPTIELTCNGRVVCKDIKYVHQLQNLYFALTSEELKLKQ